MDIREIADRYNDIVMNYSTIPDKNKFPRYTNENYVIDENQSVKWNRETVKKCNEAYIEEQKRLRKDYGEKIGKVTDEVKHYIMEETGLSYDKASILWDFTFNNHHAYMEDVWNYLDDYIGLYNDLIDDKEIERDL